jgi:hypothetical protein
MIQIKERIKILSLHLRSHICEDFERIYCVAQERSRSLRGGERLRSQNFRLALVGLVLIFVGLGAILLWTRYRSPIALVLAILCIFIGLVLVAGLGWFPMMGVEKWRL